MVHNRSKIRKPLARSKEASMVVKSSRSGSGVKPEGVVEATVFTRSFRLKMNEIIVHFTFTLSNIQCSFCFIKLPLFLISINK